MKRIALVLVAFLALAGIVGFLVTSGGGLARLSGAREEAPAMPAEAPGLRAADDLAATEEALVAVPEPGVAVEGGGSLGDIGVLPVVGPHVVKTADISVVVGRNGFDEAFRQATLVAGRYGGFVASSSASGRKVKSGTLLIRVPAASFEAALDDLRGLGEVESQSLAGEDVSAQFVDLEARLRTWEAQEAVLLRLMRQASTIADTLRIQRELQNVQLRIEQIHGQLNVLRDRTELATIMVSLREPGAVIRAEREAAQRRPSIAEAWARAVDGFLGVVFVVVVGLGYLVPLAILGGLGWLGFRRWRSRPAPSVS